MSSHRDLVFDNGFARLPEAYYSRVCPTPVPDPYLVCYSAEALALLDLDASEMTQPELIEILAGNRLLPGMDAMAASTPGTSSATTCRNSATAARSCWAR